MTRLAVPFRRKAIFDAENSTYSYFGEANWGVATSSASWRIMRLTYSGTNSSVLTIEYADGDDEFDNVWDNRASLSYS